MRERFKRVPAIWVLAIAGAPASVQASGFHVDEQDARATGRGGAVTASTDNASAIYYNPAGIAELHGVNVDVGTSFVRPTSSFEEPFTGEETDADTQIFVMPQAYVSWRASELVAVGLGYNSHFGLALKWPASSPGRAEVRHAELRSFFITPSVALNLSQWVPGLSFGAGIDLVPASVRLSRDIPFGVDTGSVTLGGDAFGLGARAGVLYRPPALPQWSFGITFRSPVALDFSGDADFDVAPAYRASLPPDGDVETSITLPATLDVGVQFSPVPELQLEVDGNWLGWSSYDRLDIELPDGSVQSAPKDWKNSLTLRVGAEYTFLERWSVRLGFILDETPIPQNRLDFQLPDDDRIDLTAGVGGRFTERIRADFGVLWVLPQERSTAVDDPLEPPIKGTFRIDVWVVGLSLGVQFDTPVARSEASSEIGQAGCQPALDEQGSGRLSSCSR